MIMAGVKLSEDPAFLNLKEYFNTHGKFLNMRQMFADDELRFEKLRFVHITLF